MGDDVDVFLGDADAFGEAAGHEEFLIGHATGEDEGCFRRGVFLEEAGGGCGGFGPGGDAVAAFGRLDERLGEAEVAIEVVEIEAVGIGDPAGIDVVVLPRGDAVDFVFAGVDDDIRSGAAGGVDGIGFLEEPDAHLEAEVFGGEGSDGAEVDGVQRVVVVEPLAWVGGEGGVGAALGEAEDVVFGDLIGEADTTAAHDAALVVEDDAGTDVDVFRLGDFGFLEAGFAVAVLDGVFLEAAFASLVADGAVEWVIDEEKLHHSLAAFLREGGFGADSHAVGYGIGAGDGGAGHPADGLVAVFIKLGLFSGGGARRHAHLDETHAAVSRGGELGVVAVVGDSGAVATRHADGFDHAGAFRNLMPIAIDLDVDHRDFAVLLVAHKKCAREG